MSGPDVSGPDRGTRGTSQFSANCVCHDELLDITIPDFLAARLYTSGIDFHLGRMAVEDVWNRQGVISDLKNMHGGAYADSYSVIETGSIAATMQVLWDEYGKPVCEAVGELVATSTSCVVHLYK